MPMCWHMSHTDRSPSSGDGDDAVGGGGDVLGEAGAAGRKDDDALAGPQVGRTGLLDDAGALVAGAARGDGVLLLGEDTVEVAHVAAADGEALQAHEGLAVGGCGRRRVEDLEALGSDELGDSHGLGRQQPLDGGVEVADDGRHRGGRGAGGWGPWGGRPRPWPP